MVKSFEHDQKASFHGQARPLLQHCIMEQFKDIAIKAKLSNAFCYHTAAEGIDLRRTYLMPAG